MLYLDPSLNSHQQMDSGYGPPTGKERGAATPKMEHTVPDSTGESQYQYQGTRR